MTSKTIKGGTLRLIESPFPEGLDFYLWFDEIQPLSKKFKKLMLGSEVLGIVEIKPDTDVSKCVYPIIKYGFDFVQDKQQATEYFLHPQLIRSEYKTILNSDKSIVTAILSPIEDYETKAVSWFISSIQW